MELSSEASMLELDVRPEWVGKNLLELNLRKKYSMNIVAIRDGKNVSTVVDPEMPMQAHWKLIVIANPSRLQKLKS
jgi:trk system potassium uptake protein TrkA